MVERCDYYSDLEYQMAQQAQEEEVQRQMRESEEQEHYHVLLSQLESSALELGIEHAISFLEALKNREATTIAKEEDTLLF